MPLLLLVTGAPPHARPGLVLHPSEAREAATSAHPLNDNPLVPSKVRAPSPLGATPVFQAVRASQFHLRSII